MANTAPVVQRTFAGGIVSDELIPRADVAKVAAGVRDMANCWTTRTGGFQNRPGMRFVQECKDSHDDIQGRTFHFNDSQAYFLEVGTKYIRFYQLAEAASFDNRTSTGQTFYLSNDADDVAAISGAGTLTEERALRTLPGPAVPMIVVGGASVSSVNHMFTTLTGDVGTGSAAWPTGDFSITIKTLAFPGYDSSSTQSVTVAATLFRIDSSGAVVEEGDQNGEGATTVATAGVTPVPGEFTLTWSNQSWMAPFNADDRLGIRLEWAHGAFWNNQICVYEIGAAARGLTSAVGKTNAATLYGWDETEDYLVGDIVNVYSYTNTPKTFYARDALPDPVPTGFSGTAADEPYGKATQNSSGNRGDMLASVSGSNTQERICLVTNAGQPGWATWQDEAAMAATVDFSSLAGTAARFYIRFARLNSSGAVQVESLFSDDWDLEDKGLGPATVYCDPPVAGWGSVSSTDRLALMIFCKNEGSAGLRDYTLDCENTQFTTVYTEDTSQIISYKCVAANTGEDPQLDDGTYWEQTSTPWDSSTAYVVGDVITTASISEPKRTFQLSFDSPSPTPATITDLSDDEPNTATLEGENETASSGSLDMSVDDTETEVFVLVTDSGEPGWDDWPIEDISVSLAITGQSGTAAGCTVTCTAVLLDENNTYDSGPTYVASSSVTIGDGTLAFTCPPPSDGWGTTASTDRLGILVTVTNANGVGTVDFDLECADAASFVTTPYYESGDGLDYWYCTADHSNKDPRELKYQDDFWYPLTGTDVDGNVLLEVPTPYAQADLAELDFNQSGNYITITHQNYPPHELVRYADDVQPFGRWTLLPIAFKPRHDPPTGITSTDPGDTSGERDIRYKVTAIAEDTGVESNAGTDASTSSGTVSNATSTTLDLSVSDATHGLETGDEIGIITVATQDSDRANQNAVEMLEGTVYTIDKTDADNFTLRNSAGLLTYPSIADTSEGYPEITITWGKAYIEYASVKVPKGTGGKRIAFEWTEVPGTREYWIYRRITGEAGSGTDVETTQDWGFLATSMGTSFADEGGEVDNTAAVVDDESPPPSYINPFTATHWPRASAYHQQRQWFAGTESNPLRVWASRIGDFRSFTRHFPTQDDDRIQFDLASEEANEVQVMRPLGQLMIFTSGGVVTLRGDQNGTLTPGAPNPVWLASEGAAIVRPVPSDDLLMYVQARGSYVREASYDVGTGGFAGFVGRDLTVFAPDLFRGYTISQLARAAVPHSIVWCVRSDGTLLGLTTMREQELWGWHRHTTLNGEFLSVATVPEENEDVLYCIVKRTLTAGTKYYVERIDVRTVGRAGIDLRKEMFFLDSGISYDGTNTDGVTTLTLTGTYDSGDTGNTLTATGGTPFAATDVGNGYRIVDSSGNEAEVEVTAFTSSTIVTVTNLTDIPAGLQAAASTVSWVKMKDDISGLDHLEGDTVYALGDANVLGPFTVSSGAIDLGSRPYGQVHVGLRITADVEMLDVDSGQDKIISNRRHVPIVTAYLHQTRRVRVGPTSDDLKPMDPDDDGTRTIDTYSTLVSEKKTRPVLGKINLNGRLLFRQVDPLPMTITGVIRHTEIGKV